MSRRKKIRIPVPDTFKRYLILIASCQNMELISPYEMFTNVTAYIGEARSFDCLEREKFKKLRAYLKKWNLVDFTEEK